MQIDTGFLEFTHGSHRARGGRRSIVGMWLDYDSNLLVLAMTRTSAVYGCLWSRARMYVMSFALVYRRSLIQWP